MPTLQFKKCVGKDRGVARTSAIKLFNTFKNTKRLEHLVGRVQRSNASTPIQQYCPVRSYVARTPSVRPRNTPLGLTCGCQLFEAWTTCAKWCVALVRSILAVQAVVVSPAEIWCEHDWLNHGCTHPTICTAPHTPTFSEPAYHSSSPSRLE